MRSFAGRCRDDTSGRCSINWHWSFLYPDYLRLDLATEPRVLELLTSQVPQPAVFMTVWLAKLLA